MPTLAVFGTLDWSVVGLYFAVITAVGLFVGRKKTSASDYFLGGRSLPTWAVAISLVATMLSAATFVGVPDIAFNGDLSYLILNVGGFIAVFVVAFLFVPRLYRAGTVTIYGFLAQRFGETARLAVSCAFIFGRLLTSAARLFLAAIPLCLLMFGAKSPTLPQLITAISLIGIVGTFYATVGGVRAVVWVDTIQFFIVVGTALLSLAILLHRIPLTLSQISNLLAHAPVSSAAGAPTKLHMIDLSLNPAKPYTLWAAIFGATFLNVAAYGVDQDLAQRFMISKSASRGGLSVIASQFIGIVVVSLFLAIGLLLYLFYDRPDVMGAAHTATADRTGIYPWFLLNELPTGLAGLAIAGFFAIAQGSLDSAMNAIASSIVADVIIPIRQRGRGATADEGGAGGGGGGGEASRWTVAGVGCAMCGLAIFCAATFDPRHRSLLDFALGVMTFALSGMLSVFLTALLTRRGNSASVIAALITGALAVTALQDPLMKWWTPAVIGHAVTVAWPWWMPAGTCLSFLVCAFPRGTYMRANDEAAGSFPVQLPE